MGPGEGPEKQVGLLITGDTARMLDGEIFCVQTLPRERGMLRIQGFLDELFAWARAGKPARETAPARSSGACLLRDHI